MKNGRPASRLRLIDTVTEATASIAQRPLRTLLTALGTILGVGAFVTTTGLADTARAQVSSRFDALKATEVRVHDATPDGTNPFPSDVDARLNRLNGVNSAGLIYSVPDNGSLQPRKTASLPIGADQSIPIIAATPGAMSASLPTIQAGRLYDDFHETHGEHVALAGRVAADQLGIERVDNQPSVFIGDTAYTLIGIIDDVRRNLDTIRSIIIPTTTAREVIGDVDTTYEVLIDTEPGAAALIGRQAPTALRPQQPGRLDALVPPDPQTLRNVVESDVTSLYYALAGLALLVGTLAIANATLLNTIERRAEIGLRRALGARRSHIARQVTLEAAIIGTVAAILGAALGVVSVAIASSTRGWTTTLDPAMLASAPIIGLVTGAVAGVGPALRAAQVSPSTTLRA
jgi:putative ABC transport system permease protein